MADQGGEISTAVDRAGNRKHNRRLGRGRGLKWYSGSMQGKFVVHLPKRLAHKGLMQPLIGAYANHIEILLGT